MHLSLPTELIREIIQIFISNAPPRTAGESPGINSKPSWSRIDSLSLASKTFRTLALEGWFQAIFLRSAADLNQSMRKCPQLVTWTRQMHVTVNLSDESEDKPAWDLRAFQRLERLRLDFCSIDILFPDFSVPSLLHILDVRGLSWPSPIYLQRIAMSFPELRVLSMRQEVIWCSLCYTCVLSSFKERPEDIVYESGMGLPLLYASSLEPLVHLHTVNLRIAYAFGGRTNLSRSHNESVWSGECDDCMAYLYPDEAFKRKYIEDKKNLAAGKKGGSRPPMLTTVAYEFRELCSTDLLSDF